MAIKPQDAEVERRYQQMLAAGEVIQMFHPGKGVRYITNTPHAIEMAKRRGYIDVEYEEEVVRRPVVKAQASAPAKVEDEPVKRGPGRPRKIQDGE